VIIDGRRGVLSLECGPLVVLSASAIDAREDRGRHYGAAEVSDRPSSWLSPASFRRHVNHYHKTPAGRQ
jgi:hypothetical protein